MNAEGGVEAKEKVGAYVNGDGISGGSGGSAELPYGDWSANLPSKYNFSSSILLLQVMPEIPWKMSPPFGHPWTKKKVAMAV